MPKNTFAMAVRYTLGGRLKHMYTGILMSVGTAFNIVRKQMHNGSRSMRVAKRATVPFQYCPLRRTCAVHCQQGMLSAESHSLLSDSFGIEPTAR